VKSLDALLMGGAIEGNRGGQWRQLVETGANAFDYECLTMEEAPIVFILRGEPAAML